MSPTYWVSVCPAERTLTQEVGLMAQGFVTTGNVRWLGYFDER